MYYRNMDMQFLTDPVVIGVIVLIAAIWAVGSLLKHRGNKQ